MSILIYDNATGDNRFGNAGNYVTPGYQPANAVPTASDIVLYGAATYRVDDFNIGGGSTDPMEGAAVFAPGANVTFDAPDPDRYTFGSLIQPHGSNVTLKSAGFSIGNVLLGPHSHLTFDEARPGTVDAISNIWNEGGTLTVDPSAGLQLGGPGFLQVSGFTPGETEVHAGTNQWIDLGNITQGSHPEALAFKLFNDTNAPEIGSLIGSAGDGGFAPFLPRVPVGAAAGQESGPWGGVSINTSTLGGHWQQLEWLGQNNKVMATTAIWDDVVKA
jgi:hypothetical protein